MLLQAIVIDDRAYEVEKTSPSFIRNYIFPGGCLPSLEVIGRCLASRTDLSVVGLEDLTPHYVSTLRRWRGNFEAASARLAELGYDERFQRLWKLYLSYCEGGFAERRIGVVQMEMAKPGWRGSVGASVAQARCGLAPGDEREYAARASGSAHQLQRGDDDHRPGRGKLVEVGQLRQPEAAGAEQQVVDGEGRVKTAGGARVDPDGFHAEARDLGVGGEPSRGLDVRARRTGPSGPAFRNEVFVLRSSTPIRFAAAPRPLARDLAVLLLPGSRCRPWSGDSRGRASSSFVLSITQAGPISWRGAMDATSLPSLPVTQ